MIFSSIQSLRATDGVRTRDPDLGKVVLYQLSHCRIFFVPCSCVSLGTILILLQSYPFVNNFFKLFLFLFFRAATRIFPAKSRYGSPGNASVISRPAIYFPAVYSSCFTTKSPNSSSCSFATAVGASVIRSDASFTLGNAITSLMLSSFAISITRRSSP